METTEGLGPEQRRGRWLRIGAIAAAVLLAGGLAFTFLPGFVARHLLASELDALGIDYEGVETLRVAPWRGEIWLGPVRFRAADAEHGRVEEIGLDLRYWPLLKRRAYIERLIVRGVDVHVIRSEDGFALNGFPLSTLLTGGGEAGEEAGASWGRGLEVLELRDSQLLFEQRGGGSARVTATRLELSGFRTWEPDVPGRFELAGRVNDIELNWRGEATPFADNIELDIQARTERATLPRVVELIGSLGLDRQAGVYGSELQHDVVIYADGRIEGRSAGSIAIEDLDYARNGVFDIAAAQGSVKLDTRFELSQSRDLDVQGRLDIALTQGSARLPPETSFGVGSASVLLADIELQADRSGNFSVSAVPAVELTGASFSGPVHISVDEVLKVLLLLQSLSAGDAATNAETGIAAWSESELDLPSSDISIKSGRIDGRAFSASSQDGEVRIALESTNTLDGIGIESGGQRIDAQRLESGIEQFSLRSGGGALELAASGTNTLSTASSSGDLGDIDVGELHADVQRFEMRAREGRIELELDARSRVARAHALAHERGNLPETTFDVEALSAVLAGGSVEATRESLSWEAAGGVEIDTASVRFAGGDLASGRIGRLVLQQASAAGRADAAPRVAAEVLTLGGLDVMLTRDLIARLLPEKTSGDGVLAPEQIQQLQQRLAELGYDPGPADGVLGELTHSAIREYQRDADLDVDGRATEDLLARLERAGREGSGGFGVALGRFALEDGGQIRFRDTIVEPGVAVDTVFRKLELRELDLRDPDTRSTLEIAADVNEFTRVELSGWVSDPLGGLDFDVTASIANLELVPYSPYAAEFGGVYVESGQLTSQSTAKAQNGKLSGEIDLELSDVEFEPLSEEDAKRLADTAGMPIKTVTNLLADNSGRIELTLPLGGTVSKPSVDLSQAISRAVGGVLKRIFPPTAIARLLARSGDGLEFEPIEFRAGSAELTDPGRAYLDELAKLLRERSKLSIDVCGRATGADLASMQPALEEPVAVPASAPSENGGAVAQTDAGAATVRTDPDAGAAVSPGQIDPELLRELATERTRAVRRALIDERGIEAHQVGECRSFYDPQEQGAPSVAVTL